MPHDAIKDSLPPTVQQFHLIIVAPTNTFGGRVITTIPAERLFYKCMLLLALKMPPQGFSRDPVVFLPDSLTTPPGCFGNKIQSGGGSIPFEAHPVPQTKYWEVAFTLTCFSSTTPPGYRGCRALQVLHSIQGATHTFPANAGPLSPVDATAPP